MRAQSLGAVLALLTACSFSGTPGSVGDGDGDGDEADASQIIEDCGNGDLDPGEGCDDGATATGDGCDDTCQIEPGFECDGQGSCVEVDDLAWVGTPTDTPDSLGDSVTGGDFELNCPSGDVAVGFIGMHGTDCAGAGGGVGRLRLSCAELDFDVAGAASRGNLSELGPVAACNPAGTQTNGTIDCPVGTVLVGIGGNPTGYMRRLEGICQPLSHVDGALTFGTDVAATGTIGPVPGTVSVRCPANQVVGQVTGGFGQVIDRLFLSCVALDVN